MVKPMVEKSPNALSVFTLARKILDLRHGERGVLDADAGRALADVDQPVLVAIDQRPQQHAADQREDGGVGADAERQREHDGDRQPLGARTASGRQISSRARRSEPFHDTAFALSDSRS